MSRAYKVEVYAKGILPEQLSRIMTKEFYWAEAYLWDYRDIVCFEGDGYLSGGQTEEEAHAEISKALKALSPGARVSTRWTYMEELPFSEYGDDLNADTPLPGQGADENEDGNNNEQHDNI